MSLDLSGAAGLALLSTACLLLLPSISTLPAFVFDGVLGLPSPVAWGLGTLTWATGLAVSVRDPAYDRAAAALCRSLTGVEFAAPVTALTGSLTALYLLTALGEAVIGDPEPS